MFNDLEQRAILGIEKHTIFFLCIAAASLIVSCSSDPITSSSTIVINPYGIEQRDVEESYALALLAQAKREYIEGLGLPRINPYGFDQSDIDAANTYVAEAQQTKAVLDLLGSPRMNPYEFSQDDIEFVDSCRETAESDLLELQNMINSADYSHLGSFIPNQNQINEARVYWAGEKNRADSVDRPYWQSERELAVLAEEPAWAELCDSMLASLSLRVKMIDTTLHGLDLDEAVVQHTSTEDAPGIVARKIAREELVIDYYDGLARVLNQAIQLEISWYGALNDFIPDQDQITEARVYWTGEKIGADSVDRPYWQSERQLAVLAEEPAWVELCDSMLASLQLFVRMIDTTLHGLELDEAVVQNMSTEDAQEIVDRKIAREELVISYYLGLARALNQAILLEVSEWSGLEILIPDSEEIEQGMTYWHVVIDSLSSIDIPFWEAEGVRAAQSGNEHWVHFTGRLLSSRRAYNDIAVTTLLDLTLDSAVIWSISAENARDIAARKYELSGLEVMYYQNLMDVLLEGISLGIVVEDVRNSH